MPPGPLWRLRYEDNIDDRIQARVDRVRFERDEFVLRAAVLRDPPDPNPGSTNQRYYWVEVQMADDREAPEEYALRDLYEQRRGFTEHNIIGFRNLLGDGVTPNQNGDVISPDARSRIIQQFISSQSGRSQLAASLVAPLRARRTFLVEQLPDGALPVYDRDPDPEQIEAVRNGLLPDVSMGTTTTTTPWERPSWLEVGAWVTKNMTAGEDAVVTYAQITELTMLKATYQIWRDNSPPKSENVIAFCRGWTNCEVPKEPENRFLRILSDDD